jgi:Uma2 family endonuclease
VQENFNELLLLTAIQQHKSMPSITFQPLQRLSPAELLAFSQLNQGLICEMNTNGSIVLKTPDAIKYNRLIEKIINALQIWNEKAEDGVVLDIKTGYALPNGAVRHPSVSWAKLYKMNTQFEHLLETTPDFFVEILTEAQSINPMMLRMREYMLNGALLGWLIDLNNERVYIFKNDGSEQVVEGFHENLNGESVLRGFDMRL